MATEVKVLDGVLASSGVTGATVANLQAQDASWAVATANNVATSVRASTPTPTGNPNVGANLQTITVQTRKFSTNTGNPTGTISVGVGGTKVLTSASFNITSTAGQVNTFTFDYSALTGAAADGSNVEIWVDTVAAGGNPSTRNSADIGYMAWTVDYSTGITGTLSKTLAALTGTGGATLSVAGTLSKTLSPLTAGGSGSLSITGTVGATLSPLTASATGTSSTFAPSDLFGVGDVGYAWNPTDLGKVWQNSDGTGAGAFTQPVGRVDDISGLNNHPSQNGPTLRPVLQDINNGMMKFDGADDILNVIPCLWAGGGGTWIAAIKGVSQDGKFLFGETNSAAGGAVWAPGLRSNVGGDMLFYWRGDNFTPVAVNQDVNVFDDTLHVYMIVDDGTKVEHYVDGNLLATHNYTSRATLTGGEATTINQAHIGNAMVGGLPYDNSTSAYIGAGIAIDRPLNATERSDANAWVTARHTAAGSTTGAVNKTLAPLTSASSGTLTISGSTSKTLAPLTSTGTAALELTGQSNVSLAALTATATGAILIEGATGGTLAALTGSGTGTVSVAGSTAATFAPLTSTATAALTVTGTLGFTFAPLTATATGVLTQQDSGTVNATLAAMTAGAVGSLDLAGGAVINLAPLTSATSGTLTLTGATAISLAPLTAQGAGSPLIEGLAAGTLAPLTGTGASQLAVEGAVGSTLDPLTLYAFESFVVLDTPSGRTATTTDAGRSASPSVSSRTASPPALSRTAGA